MRANEFITELSFFGRQCTKDCSGHKAGWEWERKHQKNTRQATPSNSFNNGTEIAVDQRRAGRHPIGPQIRGRGGRFQKFQPVVKEESTLDELIGVKKYQNLSYHQMIRQIAQDYGLTDISGRGRFGTVLQGPNPNFVYKVIEQDDAFLSFVNFVMNNPNPHYPKFAKVKALTSFYSRYNIQPDKFTVVKIEKLIPLEEGTALFASDMSSLRDLYDTPQRLPNGRENDEMLTLAELSETRPWIIDLWYAIKAIQHSKVIKGDPDMHPGNFMKRADHTIVIIDPVSDPKAFDLSREVGDLERAGTPFQVKGPAYNKK